MIFKNLFRRKGRTILTLVGIAIGVAAIVALGAVAQGLTAGFSAMTRGSQADLVISQAEALSALLSSIDETTLEEVGAWPEVAELDGVLLGSVILEEGTYLFFFGHQAEGFAIEHYRVVEGDTLAAARRVRGTPMILGRQAAQTYDVHVGDTFRLGSKAFRVVGIYETGNAFEDSGAVLPLEEAQALMLQQRRVSMIYVKLRSPSDEDALRQKVERRLTDLTVSETAGFAEQEQLMEMLEGMAMAVAGLAVIIGGIGMTNTLFMSVFERTREIGLLRAVGWGRRRVLTLILGESLALSLVGGVLGSALGVGAVLAIRQTISVLSVFGSDISPDLFVRAFGTVTLLGLVGGAYPAWWASHLLPLEALRYQGGGADVPTWLPGMTARNLWRRKIRTTFTTMGVAVGISAIVVLGALTAGMRYLMTEMWRASQADLFIIEAGVDSDFSAIEEQVGARIETRPDVVATAGVMMTAANTDQMSMMFVLGYNPREFAIKRFHIVEGGPLTGGHQVIVGRRAAEEAGVEVGDTIHLLNSRFHVVGIYETGLSFEEIGVVISLRKLQTLTGKHRQVQFYMVKLKDPHQAKAVRDELESSFESVDVSLTSEAAETMSDMQTLEEMVAQISLLAIFIGGVGMLNTMLMSVLERTREIGVLRALGWRRRRVLGMILQESLLLGMIGGGVGILLGLGLGSLSRLIPGTYGSLELIYAPQLFFQALGVALIAGAAGGLYPAWRATHMRPVEALRYE